MPDANTVNLTNCDREPIHVPGSIQPHGCLIACDPTATTIRRHSTNAGDMLAVDAEMVGARLDAILGRDVAHTLRNAVATAGDPARPALRHGLELPSGRRFDVSIHMFQSNAIFEFEPVMAANDQPLEVARMLISRIRNISNVDELLERSARLIHALLGYDRVMIYQFEQDGSGKVISEHKRRDLESFKGQYFPASDIPNQARILYLKNTIRVISDANNTRVAIVPQLDEDGAAIDLSFAHLRSVSPVHCEYLRNMGVGASMSISIIVDGELWGLIACHHYSSKSLSLPQRIAAETFGEFFSLHLSALRQKQIVEKSRAVRRSLDHFLQQASHHQDIRQLLRSSLDDFQQMLPMDGVGLWLGDTWTTVGTAPSDETAFKLAERIAAASPGKVWSSSKLIADFPELDLASHQIAGATAIPLSQRSRDYLFFFRKEMVQTLNWAGNPEKSYETGPLGDRLTPRKSFAIWKETVRDQAQPWTQADAEVADAIRAVLVEIVLHHNELIADERGKADVRQRMLNEELNHRVKNILSVIKSLVGQPVDAGQEIGTYVDSLKGRIQALALAHDQIVRSGDGGMLRDLLQAELRPYHTSEANIVLEGPSIWLDARSFSVMALVLHEMATNAAKYGALSSQGGTLTVAWHRNGSDDCEIRWSERGGPPVSPPTRSGFGSILIGRSVAYELGGQSSIDYIPTGIEGFFLIPAQHIQAEDGPDELIVIAGTEEPPAEQGEADFADVELLLVEDQMLIAADVEAMLAANGLHKVTTSPSVADAMKKLEHFSPDVAVLDVNLGTGTSLPVAQELIRRGIPLIFATGYTDRSIVPTNLDVPVLRKPYEAAALMGALMKVLPMR